MYRYILLMFCFSLVACGGSSGTSKSTSANSSAALASSQTFSSAATQLALVPLPAEVIEHNGVFDLGAEVVLSTDANAPTANQAVMRLLNSLGINSVNSAAVKIRLSLVNQADLGDEGYSLIIADDISIRAQTDAGLFYALQTLQQLLPVGRQASYKLPRVSITDVPQYAWRGSMVDVARHFFGIEYLKKHIERMAAFKLNKLHLHLSDDQGWRMEIKKYPKLTSVGGSTQAGGGPGGFYTQEELKDLVAYAANYNVEIIPELDMPGHVQAAIASYNELACDNVSNLDLYIGLNVGFSALCLTKPEVIYPFVQDVLTEVVNVFPSQYIHIGGDEIKHALYGEFIDKAGQIIKELNRTMVGWEEASAGKNLAPNTLLQLWNDDYDIKSATDRNIHLILSPCSYLYLDHGNVNGQPETYTWCRKQGVPLERVYSFNPQKYSLVTGIEAPVWSELVSSEAAMDNRMWPRLAAVAEIAWTNQSARNYQEFTQRMKSLKPYFDNAGIHYYIEPQLGW